MVGIINQFVSAMALLALLIMATLDFTGTSVLLFYIYNIYN